MVICSYSDRPFRATTKQAFFILHYIIQSLYTIQTSVSSSSVPSSNYQTTPKFIKENRLIGKFIDQINHDTGKYVCGVGDTLKALEMGAVETLIVWENLEINRYVLKNGTTNEISVAYFNKDQESDQINFRDSATNAELEVEEKMTLLEWFVDEYKKFGCTLEFVTNKSQEGSQFCRGFGGIGGILRYQLDIRSFDDDLSESESESESESDNDGENFESDDDDDGESCESE